MKMRRVTLAVCVLWRAVSVLGSLTSGAELSDQTPDTTCYVITSGASDQLQGEDQADNSEQNVISEKS